MKRTLFDNYDFDRNEIIDAILEYRDDITKDDITDTMIYDEWYNQCDIWFEDIYTDLCKLFENEKIICFGNIGRWNGYFDAGKIFDDFERAFNEMLEDCYYFKITDENGRLYIDGSHHDGNVHFEVKILTDKGKEYYDRWNYYSWRSDSRTEEQVHTQIIKRYSHLPNAFKTIYG